MSVTPDFIGQRYKDTNTGNIWIANSTTPGDWSLELQNAGLVWTPRSNEILDLSYIALSGTVTSIVIQGTEIGGFDAQSAPLVQHVSMPNLVSDNGWGMFLSGANSLLDFSADLLVIVQDFRCEDCPLIQEVLLPSLVSSSWNFLFDNNPSLTSLSAANLSSVARDAIVTECDSLTSLDLSSLQTVTLNCDIFLNPNLTSLNLSSLQSVGQILGFDGNNLSTLDLSSLVSVGDDFVGSDNVNLQTIDISSLTIFGGWLLLDNCALNQASVNAVLAQLVSIPAYGAGKTVNLGGGTNAAPSGQGIIDKGTLQGRGATVITN